jgi:acyl-coenzyme A thioesterase PaaI-like protein
MPESIKTKIQKLAFNFFPAYRGTGAWITYIDRNYREIRMKIPLNWHTRNYVGTLFGGSMFAAADPLYMIMLMKLLGKDYVVWDKSGSIRFYRPGTETIYAVFKISDDLLTELKEKVKNEHEINHDFIIEFKTKNGTQISQVTKTIYIADKNYYKAKRKRKK